MQNQQALMMNMQQLRIQAAAVAAALQQQRSLYHPAPLLAPPQTQIEPIPSRNPPPGFNSNACRSVYVGNLHRAVTEPVLQLLFATTGRVESFKLIRKEKSSYGFVHYIARRSATLAILYFNGMHLFEQPIKVNWAFASNQRDEGTSSHFNIFVGDLSPEVTDATLFACFSVYSSCSDARVMWDQKTGRSRGFGFVSFRNHQDAQSAINNSTGKWLDNRRIRCNWADIGATSIDDNQNSDANSVVEITNVSSEDGRYGLNHEAPEINPRYTTVYVGNLAPQVTQSDLYWYFHSFGAGMIVGVHVQRDRGFGFVTYNTHNEAALAIQSCYSRSVLFGKQIKCSWGTKPTPPGTSSYPLPPPAVTQFPDFSHNDMLTCEFQAAGASQAINDGGFRNLAASQQYTYYQ